MSGTSTPVSEPYPIARPRSPVASVTDSASEQENNPFFDFVQVEADAAAAPHATLSDQDINSNEHARQRRELLDLVNRLQAIG
jgi:hypothetical protein